MITDQPLESLLSSAKFATITPAMGAVSTFEGTVRDHDGGQLVDHLTYTCHPTATHVLREVAEEVVAAHPQVRAWVAHRTGSLEVGDMAFLVVIAAAHRGPAFAATAEMADQVKARVPIWKEQKLRSGATTWVGLDS
nr:molybdenum cofactor biosynthesis protein MoaE [Corynebacterium sp. HMSC22B11]